MMSLYFGSILDSGYPIGVRKKIAGWIVLQIIPISLKNTFKEDKKRFNPNVKIKNNKTHGKIKSNFRLYTMPNQYIITKKTIRVRSRLNSSPIVSDKGKK